MVKFEAEYEDPVVFGRAKKDKCGGRRRKL